MDDLIRAVACAARPCPVASNSSIAGDGPLRGMLEDLVASLGTERPGQLRGQHPHARVGEWMRSLDVFVVACKKDSNGDMDGIPVVLMEAMSQFVPVISTRLSGIPELVVDGATGLLAKPADPAAWPERIARLLDAPDLGASWPAGRSPRSRRVRPAGESWIVCWRTWGLPHAQ